MRNFMENLIFCMIVVATFFIVVLSGLKIKRELLPVKKVYTLQKNNVVSKFQIKNTIHKMEIYLDGELIK